MRGFFARCVLLSLVAGLAGCATISPWERETLARPDMEFDGNAELVAGADHAIAVREGAAGGFGTGGGGCGCN